MNSQAVHFPHRELLSNALSLRPQALTNCITQLNRLDCESESEGQNKGGNESDELANGEVGGKISFREVGALLAFLSLSGYTAAASQLTEVRSTSLSS